MIHLFTRDGVFVALDVSSGAVHQLDALGYAVLGEMSDPPAAQCPRGILDKLAQAYPRAEIKEAYAELYSLYQAGVLFSRDEPIPAELIKPRLSPIKALCLHVSHDCNMRCAYCFAQTGNYGEARKTMTPNVARAAIDFVVRMSGKRRNIEIDFFGGEPLMAWDTVKDTVAYANEQGALHDKRFRFTLTTNGVLLSGEINDYINKEMSNVVLSVDGRREVHDRMRKTVNGKGTYDAVMPKFRELIGARPLDKDYYMRGTYTRGNLDFSRDVLDIYDQGFDQISIEPVVAPEGCGYELRACDLEKIQEEYWHLADEMLRIQDEGGHLNFFHFNVDLEQGPCVIKRLRGCGAGCEYVAVTPDGEIYPCHQFVGNRDFLMGNILDGSFDREKAEAFSGVSVYTREKCRDCWARFYCSGGCSAANFNAHGDIDKNYEIACALEKMRLECAIYLAVKRAQRGGERANEA